MRQELSDRELHDRYDESLNECYGPTIHVCGCEYLPSRTFKEVDPIAYRCGFNDWLDAEIQEGIILEEDDKYYLAD